MTLCTGSSLLHERACRPACDPASCQAVVCCSSSLMTIERRSAPIRTLSLAISKSLMETASLSWRAASSAASLTRFSRSAPDEAGRAARDDLEVDVGRERHLLGVHAEDAFAAAHVGPGHDDAAVEAAGAQDGRVEHVGAVGGGDDDDALVRLEAVHLDEELVQRLLALVVAAAEAGAAVTTDGVDLVDEDDAGRVLLALLEEVANAAGADADEHLDEVGARDARRRARPLRRRWRARAASCRCPAGPS